MWDVRIETREMYRRPHSASPVRIEPINTISNSTPSRESKSMGSPTHASWKTLEAD